MDPVFKKESVEGIAGKNLRIALFEPQKRFFQMISRKFDGDYIRDIILEPII